jgi:hypothetical protein
MFKKKIGYSIIPGGIVYTRPAYGTRIPAGLLIAGLALVMFISCLTLYGVLVAGK